MNVIESHPYKFTIYPESLIKDMPSVLPNLTPLRKAPTKRIFKPDEFNSTSYKNLEMNDYSQLNESTLQYLDDGYLYSTCEDHIVFFLNGENYCINPRCN